MVKINCLKTLENCEWILSKIGIWPTVGYTRSKLVKLIINWFLYISIFFILLFDIKMAIKSENFKQLNTMTCILMPFFNLVAKSTTLLTNRKEFCSLLEDLKSDFFNTHNAKLNEHIQLISRVSNILLRYFALALASYIAVGIIVPLVKDMEIIVPAPFNTGSFDRAYKCYFLLTSLYMAFEAVGFDVLYITLLCLGCAQLNILKERLANMADYFILPKEDRYTTKSRIEYILIECIILHETINQYVQKLNVILSFPLFIQYTCGCFIICNTVLQLTLWSNKIIEAAYSSLWYDLGTHAQKTLLLLMERAKRPLNVQLYEFIFISLESLGTTVRWAYSVFALMKARYS